MVKVCVLGSGSKGNATYININGYEILLDAGFSYKELRKRLALISKRIENIKTVFITHQHIDHTQAVSSFKKKGVRIYSEEDKNVLPGKEIILPGNTKITPFRLSHDVPCVGYRVAYEDFALVYVTDTGCVLEESMPYLFDATVKVSTIHIVLDQ